MKLEFGMSSQEGSKMQQKPYLLPIVMGCSLWAIISTDFRNIISLKWNTAVFILTWQENVSNAFVTNINWAAPITNTWSFSVCGKTNTVHYWNIFLEMYQHMYPVIICLLHVGIQTPVTFRFILLVLFLILGLDLW